MKLRAAILAFFILFLYGCTNQKDPEEKNCLEDKECLTTAFKNCENAYGTWQGEEGEIEIQILNKTAKGCTVSITIKENNLSITEKKITCEVPLNDTDTFAIQSQCRGELKEYYER